MMYLEIIFSNLDPAEIPSPSRCIDSGCSSRQFRLYQVVKKKLWDTAFPHVHAFRYMCLECKRTFRVYPMGTTRAQISQRVKQLAVVLYLLGLSYGAASRVMGAIGTYICKSRVYDAVQEIKQCFPEIQREQIFDGLRLPASRGEIMSVKCCGKWRQFSITTDPTGGLRFLLKIPLAVEVQVLVPRFESLATAMGAQVLVNDNAYQESVK